MERLCELLKSREMWDVVSALRGPDYPADALKWIFTARLRVLAVGGGRVADSEADVRRTQVIYMHELWRAAEEGRMWANDTMWGFNHWLIHMHRALVAIWKEVRKQGTSEAIEKELAELLQLLYMFERYAYNKLSLEELSEEARKLSIVEG